MFEVGRSYEIRWLDGEDETRSVFEVVAWEAPLLKCRQPGAPDTIFNTASRSFIRASISQRDQGPADFDDLRIERRYR